MIMQDIKAGKDRYYTEDGVRQRMTHDTKGIFTVNYPDDNGYPTHKAFSGVRNPTTQSIFGAYAPMPNANSPFSSSLVGTKFR